MLQFSIKELEILSGIKAHTIRIWEQRYNLLKPSRSNTNIRYYSREELQLLLHISLLNNHGFKISVLSQMSPEKMQQTIKDLTTTEAQETFIVHQLLLKLFDLDIDSFNAILNEYIKEENINNTISKIIDPFLQKIELLESEGYLKKEYQQLLLNSIRQKLIAGIIEQSLGNNENSKTIISFLPENHYYELELLYMQYLLRKNGLHVIYLGGNVPVKDIITIASYKKPHFVHMHLNNINHHLSTYKNIEKLARQFSETTIVITGNNMQWRNKNIPANVKLKVSVAEAARAIVEI